MAATAAAALYSWNVEAPMPLVSVKLAGGATVCCFGWAYRAVATGTLIVGGCSTVGKHGGPLWDFVDLLLRFFETFHCLSLRCQLWLLDPSLIFGSLCQEVYSDSSPSPLINPFSSHSHINLL